MRNKPAIIEVHGIALVTVFSSDVFRARRSARRTAWRARWRRRAPAAPLLDLTVSNPTRAGIAYPPDLLAPLADPAALTYRPAPLGLATRARRSPPTYARRGLRIDADRIVLTASTSEAYSHPVQAAVRAAAVPTC